MQLLSIYATSTCETISSVSSFLPDQPCHQPNPLPEAVDASTFIEMRGTHHPVAYARLSQGALGLQSCSSEILRDGLRYVALA